MKEAIIGRGGTIHKKILREIAFLEKQTVSNALLFNDDLTLKIQGALLALKWLIDPAATSPSRKLCFKPK